MKKEKTKYILKKIMNIFVMLSVCYVYFYGALAITENFTFALLTTLITAIGMEVSE